MRPTTLAPLALLLLSTPAAASQGPVRGPEAGPPSTAPAERPLPAPGQHVPDAAGTALDGTVAGWRAGAGERGTVLALTSVTCPLSRRFGPALARIEDEARAGGVRFVHVNVSGLDDREAMARQVAELGLEGLYLADTDGALARALGARTTTEVFVVDAGHTLVYRGAVSDQYGLRHALEAPRETYLRDALDALLAGERPRARCTEAPGCVVETVGAAPADPEPVTWSREVSRLLQEHCVACHRDGGVAPFPLERYEDAAPRARMLAATVEDGLMPPWFSVPVADAPHAGFANDASLDARERALLGRWVAAGKPRGDAAEAPLPRRFPDSRWHRGEPDAVFALPRPVPVRAEGVMDYVHLTLPTGLTEDRWVEALQILPTERSVVHHVLVFALPEAAFEGGRLRDPRSLDETEGFFAAYVPGNDRQVFPAGHAKLLPARSVLLFQVHYTPNGTPVEDRTELGLYFADGPPAHRVRTAGVANRRIRIPAGAAHHEEQAAAELPRDARLLAFLPHLHVRGSGFRYDLLEGTPDGPGRVLLDVPDYDFNWQLRYQLREPLEVPAGSVLRIHAWYDNSAGNPANPDPGREVDWGPQTTDEMMLGYVEYVLVDEDPAAEERLPPLLAGQRLDALQARLDRDGDGRVDREETPRALRGAFERLDRDGDGALDRLELARSAGLRRE